MAAVPRTPPEALVAAVPRTPPLPLARGPLVPPRTPPEALVGAVPRTPPDALARGPLAPHLLAQLTRTPCLNTKCSFLCHLDRKTYRNYCCGKCAYYDDMGFHRSGRMHGPNCDGLSQEPTDAD